MATISHTAHAAVEAWLDSRPDIETRVRDQIVDLAVILADYEFGKLPEASQAGSQVMAAARADGVAFSVTNIWLYIVAEASLLAAALEAATDPIEATDYLR